MNTTPRDHTPNNDWEGEMSDEFERRVRDLHEAPLSFDSVKGRAMKIRARRRAAVAGGILAAAAVIVPVAVLAGGGLDRAERFEPAETPSVSVTDPATPEPSDPVEPTDPTEAPTSTPGIGVAYVAVGDGNAVLHGADGSVTELPRPDYSAAADLGSTIAALRRDDNGNVAVDLISGGQVTKTYAARASMVIDPTGSAVGFVTDDGELLVVSDAGETKLADVAENAFPAALIGNGDCADADGCRVFLNDGSGEKAPWVISSDGTETEVVPGSLGVDDADDSGLVSVQTASTDTGSCSGLYDRSAQDFVFTTCDSQVLDISPDGTHVLGTDPYGDGLGLPFVTILDDQGREQARLTPDAGVINAIAWVDDTHAIASVHDAQGWSIMRFGLDEEPQVVVGPTTLSDEMSPAYWITGGS